MKKIIIAFPLIIASFTISAQDYLIDTLSENKNGYIVKYTLLADTSTIIQQLEFINQEIEFLTQDLERIKVDIRSKSKEFRKYERYLEKAREKIKKEETRFLWFKPKN